MPKKHTVKDLKMMCKEKGIKGYSKMKKGELMAACGIKPPVKRAGPKTLNAYMKAVIAARNGDKPSFVYNGNTYVRGQTKTGLVVYKKALK